MNDIANTKPATIPVKEFLVLVPLVAGAVVVAYDVGYFAAFDLDYFSFFSLSEHVVLALQALPLPLIATIVACCIATIWIQVTSRSRFLPHLWHLIPCFVLMAVGTGLRLIGLWGLGIAVAAWLVSSPRLAVVVRDHAIPDGSLAGVPGGRLRLGLGLGGELDDDAVGFRPRQRWPAGRARESFR